MGKDLGYGHEIRTIIETHEWFTTKEVIEQVGCTRPRVFQEMKPYGRKIENRPSGNGVARRYRLMTNDELSARDQRWNRSRAISELQRELEGIGVAVQRALDRLAEVS